MEYCSGGDLSSFIHSRRSLRESSARKFLRQLGKVTLVPCVKLWTEHCPRGYICMYVLYIGYIHTYVHTVHQDCFVLKIAHLNF